MLALAIVLVASASCEAVVSLDHFDDGVVGARDGAPVRDGAALFDDGGAAFDDAPNAAMDGTDGDGVANGAARDGRTDGGPDCPSQWGPPPVQIETSRGNYCIDSTEVTNSQYAQFLVAIVPANAKRPPGCERQNTFTPHGNWPFPPGRDEYPVVSVDWCQAYAYCAWTGKRLCGQIGGGALALGPPENDALQAQWFNACSAGGQFAYPYGRTFDPARCSSGPGRPTLIQPVATQLSCVGGYPGIYDMTGNVWEWADVCDTTGPNSLCHVYGGAFDSNQAELTCSFSGRASARTGTGANNIGIRCCADL